MPPADRKPPPSPPVPAAAAWVHAQRGVIPANLPDGAAYQPGLFLDAHTSVGTAASADGKSLRLVLLGVDAAVRQLRRLPLGENPSFQTFAVEGTVLVWAEGTRRGGLRLWRADLRDARPARELTADTGAAAFYHSQYDLVIAGGRLHWVASGAEGVTEVRSVALTGGPVETRIEAGTWELSAWPWLVNGITASTGATLLRNMATHRDVTISRVGARSTTACSPAWCRVVTLSGDGFNRIDLMHPDGTARTRIGGGSAATIIDDVAPLDRFEVTSQIGPDSELTGNIQLLVYEIAARRTVVVSPDAGRVSYRNGVLWWATGSQNTFIWHTVDLRSV